MYSSIRPATLTSVLATRRPKVCVIYSSVWRASNEGERDGIELFGFLSPSALIAAIPAEFSGALDLATCFPRDVVIDLFRETNLTVLRWEELRNPFDVAAFYCLLFARLANFSSPYIEAIDWSEKKFRELRLAMETMHAPSFEAALDHIEAALKE